MKETSETRMARSDVMRAALLGPAWPSLFLLYWERKPVSFSDIEEFCGKDAAGFFEHCIWTYGGRPSREDLVTTHEPIDNTLDARGLSFVLTKRGRSFMASLETLMTGVEWWRDHRPE